MPLDNLTADMLRAWINRAADVLSANRTYLSDLDSPIGDADHGNNMDRGFTAARTALPDGNDAGAVLKSVAMTLISKVGGAAGPLYGTFFLEASKVLTGHTEVDGAILAKSVEAGIAGVKKRGKSDICMKTMLDALVPAGDVLSQHLETKSDISAALIIAAQAAQEGATNTIPMLAQRGRASYLGARSIGHQDPGATSSALILQALADTVAET